MDPECAIVRQDGGTATVWGVCAAPGTPVNRIGQSRANSGEPPPRAAGYGTR